MTGSLVWLGEPGFLEPQKWPDDSPDWNKKLFPKGSGRQVLAAHKLTEEEFALPIAELVKKYPAP